jgi:hypothetical protein
MVQIRKKRRREEEKKESTGNPLPASIIYPNLLTGLK